MTGGNGIEFRKEFFADERDDNLNEVGKPTRRQDIPGHVTGRSPFYDDHRFDGLLHIRCVRSPHHHARIRRIDTTDAARMPGVRRVLVGADVPRNLNTLLSLLDFGLDDEPLLAETKVAYKGEPVAAVIAETEAQARAAVARVRVDWEVMPHVLDVEEAIKPGAPTVCEVYPTNKFIYHGKYDHQKLRFGDVEAAFARADHIVEGRYQMSPIEQAPIETCGAIAAPEQNDRYVCYTSTQALFFSLGTAAKVLTMPSSRLHFIGGTVGGGFGGKVDSIHEPIAILGAMLTGRPCKFMWDREEEMQVGAPRGAERWYLKDAVMRDGRIIARKFTGYFDSGAYTRLSSYAIIKGVGHLPGPYTIPNVHADVYCVYTNRTPATAMRGFGITGVDFAIETHMDKVADVVGMNPVDLRILNAYRDGDMKAHRRLAKNTALIECCQVVADKAGIALTPASRAASSLKDGGGERAALPSHTVTDQAGRVQGFDTGSYARKGAKPAPEAMMPPASPRVPPTPIPFPTGGGEVPPPPVAPTPAPKPSPAQAPETTPAPARTGALRFSSLSGFRRR
ncbi:MAG: molybdopterin-dependent oxidoreductase [Pseudotabrizicola sp.]|uniref:xanthine dehydrogenase family protein molybdopterin-binding subunit n=1 Tax=Pseudotabrizicola sp. TaxID=2939647 RepID=UPI0027161DD0|nr:molybdopterin cofactor-binding domain-containing protein [Pseudotabrizicola sp.]MDO9637589.1 molybdopterin-dependent oxidoreductase [Pseudotabrizicola sp.]